MSTRPVGTRRIRSALNGLARAVVIATTLPAVLLALGYQWERAGSWWLELLQYLPWPLYLLPALASFIASFLLRPVWRLAASTILLPPADLTVAKTHAGNFSQGQVGATYTIVVSNAAGVGPVFSGRSVTVVDTLPVGLTATGLSGAGWTCVVGTITCTRIDGLAAGASYPVITLTLDVAANAVGPLVNSVTVSGGGQINTSNDTATDSTTIDVAPNLLSAVSRKVHGVAGTFDLPLTLVTPPTVNLNPTT